MIEWLSSLNPLVTAGVTFGGTAFGAWVLRANTREQTRVDYWQKLVQSQDARIQVLTDKMSQMEARQDKLEREIQVHRSKYWSALEHIRALTMWGHSLGAGQSALPEPGVPELIVEDLYPTGAV